MMMMMMITMMMMMMMMMMMITMMMMMMCNNEDIEKKIADPYVGLLKVIIKYFICFIYSCTERRIVFLSLIFTDVF